MFFSGPLYRYCFWQVSSYKANICVLLKLRLKTQFSWCQHVVAWLLCCSVIYYSMCPYRSQCRIFWNGSLGGFDGTFHLTRQELWCPSRKLLVVEGGLLTWLEMHIQLVYSWRKAIVDIIYRFRYVNIRRSTLHWISGVWEKERKIIFQLSFCLLFSWLWKDSELICSIFPNCTLARSLAHRPPFQGWLLFKQGKLCFGKCHQDKLKTAYNWSKLLTALWIDIEGIYV